jgi:hypothetical protein
LSSNHSNTRRRWKVEEEEGVKEKIRPGGWSSVVKCLLSMQAPGSIPATTQKNQKWKEGRDLGRERWRKDGGRKGGREEKRKKGREGGREVSEL